MKTLIYSKYSNERNKKLAIRTDILEDVAGKRYVQKKAVFPEGEEHVTALCRWYQIFSKMCQGTKLSYNRCEIIPGGVELEYLTGETLEEHLLKVQKENGIEACAKEFLDYLQLIRELHVGTVFEPTAEFEVVFGKTALQRGSICAPCSNIDLVCNNILLNNDNWTAIDYEWSFDFPIPVNYLLYRIIFYFTEQAGRNEFLEMDLLGKMGISQEERREFAEMEENFQQYVCRNYIPMRDFYADISEGIYRIETAMQKECLQLFFDCGKGISEKNVQTYPMENWSVRKQIPLPEGIKMLRVDPGSAAGVAEIRELRFDNQEKRVPFILREGAIIGNWLYFGDDDPNILINEIPAGAKSLIVDMKVYTVDEVPMEKISRLAKDYVKQKHQLREMENTKVWKLYRKYREVRERK